MFSVDDESSFNAIYSYYSRMIHLRSNNDIPVFLVGTQGLLFEFISIFIIIDGVFGLSTEAISETNPRIIDESRARKLCMEIKRCTYYETCATNGLRVEDVFSDGE